MRDRSMSGNSAWSFASARSNPSRLTNHLHGLATQPIRSATYQDVEALAGIDADVDGEGAGEGGFLIGGHGAAREKGSRRSDYVLAGRVKRE